MLMDMMFEAPPSLLERLTVACFQFARDCGDEAKADAARSMAEGFASVLDVLVETEETNLRMDGVR